jgi:hypothetical protein
MKKYSKMMYLVSENWFSHGKSRKDELRLKMYLDLFYQRSTIKERKGVERYNRTTLLPDKDRRKKQ